jgi:ATP-dependent helicase HrpB
MACELPDLPIRPLLGDIAAALEASGAAALAAPPGAGKSTLVPLALLATPWLAGATILMLEPRRLAARAVATRMASLLGEAPGGRVGFRTRLEAKTSARTRIEVITEGILTRRLQSDPGLHGVGLLIFDEFHERSLHGDLGLALSLDAREQLAAPFRVLVMSATLEAERVTHLLGGAPLLTSEERSHPVEIRHERVAPGELERAAAATVRRVLAAEPGDVLVFLPGAPEIRRVARLLAGTLPASVHLFPLFGDLPAAEQDLALSAPRPGLRKVVLSTAIAETSLTIEGVRTVIDSGLARRASFDPVTGLSGLVTRKASLATGAQRAGRAGRLSPGVCYRLYSAADERGREAFSPAEMLEADLAPLALELALWGAPVERLRFLDPPPPAALARARSLLESLDALDAHGAVTADGRRMAALGTHPRLARLLLEAGRQRVGALGAELAALLTERDIVRGAAVRDADLRKRLLAVRGEESGLTIDRGALARVRQLAARWQRSLGDSGRGNVDDAGLLLAAGYPDRIAQQRGDRGRYLLATGRGAAFDGQDALAREEFLAVAELDDRERDARILLAAPVAAQQLALAFPGHLRRAARISWDARTEAVIARTEERFGALLLRSFPLEAADPEAMAQALLAGLAGLTLEALPWTAGATALRARIAFAARLAASGSWPDVSDAGLHAEAARWLLPFLHGMSRREHLARVPLEAALRARLTAEQQRRLESLAPSHFTVPSGSRIAIDYGEDPPSLAVRLQEMFGCTQTPSVGEGRVPLVVKLLSPAGRPVQVTRDLTSFWARGYPEVRRELKGRYPRHHWPDDPLAAQPTARARPRR